MMSYEEMNRIMLIVLENLIERNTHVESLRIIKEVDHETRVQQRKLFVSYFYTKDDGEVWKDRCIITGIRGDGEPICESIQSMRSRL